MIVDISQLTGLELGGASVTANAEVGYDNKNNRVIKKTAKRGDWRLTAYHNFSQFAQLFSTFSTFLINFSTHNSTFLNPNINWYPDQVTEGSLQNWDLRQGFQVLATSLASLTGREMIWTWNLKKDMMVTVSSTLILWCLKQIISLASLSGKETIWTWNWKKDMMATVSST